MSRICLNQSVLNFMSARIDQTSRVLEIGGGFSSGWFAQRAGQVLTIETDPGWARVAQDQMSLYGPQHQVTYTRHVAAIEVSGLFDLVLVDCVKSQRHEAALLGWKVLRPDGYLIFDDAQRPEHRKTIAHLNSLSWGRSLVWNPKRDLFAAKNRVARAYKKG